MSNQHPIAKYPRTPHLEYSPGKHRDDRQWETSDHLIGKPLTITEKLDGSGVCLTTQNLYARSRNDGPTHPSFAALWPIWASIRSQIEPNISLFGEWCYAVHAVTYPKIGAGPWLYLFGARNEQTQTWASFQQIQTYAQTLQLPTVPIDTQFTPETHEELKTTILETSKKPSLFGPEREGLVIRVTGTYPNNEFDQNIAKWVREGHVAGEHWQKRIPLRHDGNQ